MLFQNINPKAQYIVQRFCQIFTFEYARIRLTLKYEYKNELNES